MARFWVGGGGYHALAAIDRPQGEKRGERIMGTGILRRQFGPGVLAAPERLT
jgi:hypothetical protein